jgi:hypothetical protein
MELPVDFVKVYGGKRYRVSNSTLLARSNSAFLFRAPKGDYFQLDCFEQADAAYAADEGQKHTTAIPDFYVLDEEEALHFYQEYGLQLVSFEEAFPDRTVEEA